MWKHPELIDNRAGGLAVENNHPVVVLRTVVGDPGTRVTKAEGRALLIAMLEKRYKFGSKTTLLHDLDVVST